MNKLTGKVSNINTFVGVLQTTPNLTGLASTTTVAGATDYNRLKNKPTINSVELVGNKDLTELGAESIQGYEIKNLF